MSQEDYYDPDEVSDDEDQALVYDNLVSRPKISSGELKLKPDHHKRPLYITNKAKIYLEAFHKLYEYARDFLVAIAEPLCRPQFIHEFEMTGYSLYTAVSIGLETEQIIKYLNLLCKTNLPEGIVEFIKMMTGSKGKVRMIVRNNAYHLESYYPEVMAKLLANPEISRCRAKDPEKQHQSVQELMNLAKSQSANQATNPVLGGDKTSMLDILDDLDSAVESAKLDLQRKKTVSFPILKERVEDVQRICLGMEEIGPLQSEYDFRNHKQLEDVKIELRSNAVLRPYQEKSLRKMFGNGCAKSGLIVLPCGAGKTLCGVTAVTTIRKRCIVLCTSAYAVEQWAAQFLLWTTADASIGFWRVLCKRLI